MEALGMLLIALLAYALMNQPEGINKAIPILGALAFGAQRLLPILQQAYGAWTSINGGKASLQDTLELLDQSLPNFANQQATQAIPFQRNIRLKDVCFRYSLIIPYVFKDVNLTISKGSRVGFVGATGAGKSTLLDIIMGMLEPTDGSLEVDGLEVNQTNHRAWQTSIAHVPQAIFLADSTIEENIAFGIPKGQIDYQRVRKAAQQAQISGFIENLPKKYQTFVGERGVRLSGGQRQRIGIARALYKQVSVIIFDEATSALDNETESAVMQTIQNLSLDITLLIIAHRVTTLKNCTEIIELHDSGIKRVGSYSEIIENF
jgi:ATP-binding cassette subfamily B protein